MAPPDRQDFGFTTNKNRSENCGDGQQVIVPESGTPKRTHLAPLYHPDTLVNPDTYIVVNIFTVYMFVCGALSLTLLTISRVLGIVFPKVAEFLTHNRWVIFIIIFFIHISSLLCTWPSIDYDGWRRSWVTHYANLDHAVCVDSKYF